MTRILVTGGSGFIGKHLVSALIARGRQVRVLDLQPPPRALPQVQYVRGSVLDRDLVDRAMDGVDEVYHLAGLPGMWLPRKADFHTVNFGGTEIVIETARKRGIKRFLHCSTESILFRASPSMVPVADDAFLPDDMPGPYTRSKMLADRFAMQAAASGYPVIIGCPTMPVGPYDHNVTPPTAMLRYFLSRRLQLHLDFVVNLVDVRDAAEGLILAMERGQRWTSLRSRRRKHAAETGSRTHGRDQRSSRPAHSCERQGRRNGHCNAGVHRRSRDAPASVRYGRRRSYRIAGGSLVDRESATRAGLCAGPRRTRVAGNHCASA